MWRFLVVAALSSCFFIWSAGAKATVQYVHPENFTDVSFRSMTHEAAEERLERGLTKTIEAAAAQYLSKYQLDVQILDVAMPGREAFDRPGFNSDLSDPESDGETTKNLSSV